MSKAFRAVKFLWGSGGAPGHGRCGGRGEVRGKRRRDLWGMSPGQGTQLAFLVCLESPPSGQLFILWPHRSHSMGTMSYALAHDQAVTFLIVI